MIPFHDLTRRLTDALDSALDIVEQQRVELDRLRLVHEREAREFDRELAAARDAWPNAEVTW